MKKIPQKDLIAWSLLGSIGLVLFLIFDPKVNPIAKVEMTIGREEATAVALDYLHTKGFRMDDIDSLYRSVRFLPSQVQQKAYQVFGFTKEDFEFLEKRSPAYYWSVAWFDPAGRAVYEAVISPDGVPFGFNHYMPEDLPGKILSQDEARTIIDEFLVSKMHLDLSNYELLEVSSDRQAARTDYFFNYYSRYSFPGDIQLRLRTTVRGDKVDHVTTYFHLPERLMTEGAQELQNENIARLVVVPLVLVIIFVILSVLYILRFHAGEIAVKAPVVVGIVYAVVMAAVALNSLDSWSIIGPSNLNPPLRMIGVMIVWILGGVIGAVMILQAWAVGDSLVREKWGNKLVLFDKISTGRVFFPSLLPSLYVGYMAGLLAAGLWSALAYLCTQYLGAWTETRASMFLYNSYAPALEVIGEGFTDALFYTFVGPLFLVAFFKKYLKFIKNDKLNTFIALALMSVLISFGQSLIPLYPIEWRLGITIISGFLLGWVFVRYDLISVLVATFVLSVVPYAAELLYADYPYFMSSGIVSYIIALAPLGIGVVAYIWGKELTPEELESAPSYVRLITQRERLEHELEIARTVQMSLLPKANPITEGFDIAGTCIPALEVGGDYYDFFQLGEGKIGIAIGDVSGKGVPAAIYMTLTKGILQSYANGSVSPKEVLTNLNKQIYSNIERNSFVSVFYGVLDMPNHTIRVARAGHSPAILTQKLNDTNRLVVPKGMAVGLESGLKFLEVLEEDVIQLQSGDVLTFYTDGFSEARTRTGEEFGDERMLAVISQHKDLSANAIIQKVVRSVKDFIGTHPQHDDMTIVVVKAL